MPRRDVDDEAADFASGYSLQMLGNRVEVLAVNISRRIDMSPAAAEEQPKVVLAIKPV